MINPSARPIAGLYVLSANASTAAMSSGIASGRQPAITPLAAMFHGVACRFACGSTAIGSCGARSVCARNALTRSRVGGTIGSSSVHRRLRKCALTSSKSPSNTMASPRDPATALALATAAAGSVSSLTIRPNSTSSTLRTTRSSSCTPTAPGYSPIRRSASPSAFATARAIAVNPVVVMTTLGMPSFSASMAGLTEAGVQVPQPPLPVIRASAPRSFASAATCFATCFCVAGSPPT